MKGLVIILVIVFIALVAAGLLIFSGDNEPQDISGGGVPETNNQTETPIDTGTETQTQPQTYNIEIENYAFSPSTLTVNVGDTIIWTNKDSTQHTVTSDSGNELNSQYLSNGNTYSHTFTQTGTYKYHCRPHPYMKGTIVVE